MLVFFEPLKARLVSKKWFYCVLCGSIKTIEKHVQLINSVFSVFVMVFMQKHMPKTTHIQHFSGELKFTAIECIIQEGLTIFIYNEPTQKLVEPKK